MINVLKIKTKCNLYPGSVHTVYVHKAVSVLGNPPAYLPNGCDFFNGSTQCKNCNFVLVKMLENGFEPFSGQIVEPDLSLLK